MRHFHRADLLGFLLTVPKSMDLRLAYYIYRLILCYINVYIYITIDSYTYVYIVLLYISDLMD